MNGRKEFESNKAALKKRMKNTPHGSNRRTLTAIPHKRNGGNNEIGAKATKQIMTVVQ